MFTWMENCRIKICVIYLKMAIIELPCCFFIIEAMYLKEMIRTLGQVECVFLYCTQYNRGQPVTCNLGHTRCYFVPKKLGSDIFSVFIDLSRATQKYCSPLKQTDGQSLTTWERRLICAFLASARSIRLVIPMACAMTSLQANYGKALVKSKGLLDFNKISQST